MKPEELAEIKSRIEKASPGPWESGAVWLIAPVVFNDDQTKQVTTGATCCAYCHLGEPIWSKLFDFGLGKGLESAHCHRNPEPFGTDKMISGADGPLVAAEVFRAEDVEFIAHAHQDVLTLVAEVERLNRHVEQITEAWTEEIRRLKSPAVRSLFGEAAD